MPDTNKTVQVARAMTLRFKNADLHLDRVIEEFLKLSDTVAPRRIEMPKGVLFLQMTPGDPNSGGIYLYDREQQDFLWLAFEGEDYDHLSLEDFDRIIAEYDLLAYTEKPRLLQVLYQTAGSA